MHEESGGFSSRQVMHSGFCLITLVAKVWGEGLEEADCPQEPILVAKLEFMRAMEGDREKTIGLGLGGI